MVGLTWFRTGLLYQCYIPWHFVFNGANLSWKNLSFYQIYCVVKEVDPRLFCESMNNCYPPDTRQGRPLVSERTPWAVKAKLQSDGNWLDIQRSAVRSHGKGPRMTNADKYIKIAGLADIHMQTQHKVVSMYRLWPSIEINQTPT